MEQDPAFAAAGSHLTCVVGGVCGDPFRRIWFQSTRFKCRSPTGVGLLLPARPHRLEP
jgi:hypothetical protein